MYIIKQNLGSVTVNPGHRINLKNMVGKELPQEAFDFYNRTKQIDNLLAANAIEKIEEKPGNTNDSDKPEKKDESVRKDGGGKPKNSK